MDQASIFGREIKNLFVDREIEFFFVEEIASKKIVILDCSCIRLLVSYRGFVCE